jgi:hypothetical protein
MYYELYEDIRYEILLLLKHGGKIGKIYSIKGIMICYSIHVLTMEGAPLMIFIEFHIIRNINLDLLTQFLCAR